MKNFMRLNFAKAIVLVGCFSVMLVVSNCSKDETVVTKPPMTSTSIGTAQVWLTTGDQAKLLSKETDISLTKASATTLPAITLDSVTRYQQIEGFGAALTGSSAYVFNHMPSSQRTSLLTELFNATTGIGISYMRLTIGASDFSTSNYSYDDVAAGSTDYNMTNFTLAPDKVDVIPMAKAIVAINPSLKILGSPWSPPAWMKTSGSMIGGSLKTDAYAAYANYFLKYVNGMKAEGITIDALTLQNEPLFSTATYPCMSMTATEQKDFIVNNVGPLFASQLLTTKIIVYDHNWDHPEYPMTILNDAAAKQYVVGSAFHGYGGTVPAMTTVHSAAPDKGLYFTEQSGGGWMSASFSDNLLSFVNDVFIGTTSNWSKNTVLWNLALDEKSGPQNNGCSNCRGVVTVNSTTNAVTRNVEYYSIGHFSKFVRPGAYRIATAVSGALSNVNHVAFLNSDGSKAIVVSNSASTSQTFVVKLGSRQLTYSIAPTSVITILWN